MVSDLAELCYNRAKAGVLRISEQRFASAYDQQRPCTKGTSLDHRYHSFESFWSSCC